MLVCSIDSEVIELLSAQLCLIPMVFRGSSHYLMTRMELGAPACKACTTLIHLPGSQFSLPSYYNFNKTIFLIYLLIPEYQAAARLVLTTISTGTRSARALLEARIVRRIPFPAFVEIKNNGLIYVNQSAYIHRYTENKNILKYS